MTDIPLTTFQPAELVPLREHVPEGMRIHCSAQSHEYSARELMREGFSDRAIAEALNLDVKAVRKMIGADL
jgi:DNA-binding NarL/FixJ family response regulator